MITSFTKPWAGTGFNHIKSLSGSYSLGTHWRAVASIMSYFSCQKAFKQNVSQLRRTGWEHPFYSTCKLAFSFNLKLKLLAWELIFDYRAEDQQEGGLQLRKTTTSSCTYLPSFHPSNEAVFLFLMEITFVYRVCNLWLISLHMSTQRPVSTKSE